ncbi:MAG: histidinol-phosphate transaminase, partial [Clostridiales bacterium]
GSNFARKNVMNLPPYVAGKPIEAVEREYGVTNIIKMASNENPLHISPLAVEAMKKELEKCYMYPEGSSPQLREKLALKYGVDAKQIICGDGGDHVIGLICHAFINDGDEVIIGDPSFPTYSINVPLMGGILVKVPMVNYAFDLDAVLAAITPKTKMIFFCNPNNPTGTIVRRDKVADFMSKIPDSVIVVFDEAYFEFVDDPAYPNGLEYVKAEKNVIVLRTFSKIYGLAGLRIGYAVAPLHLMTALGRVIPAFPVNRLAQVAAVAALDDTEFLTAVKKNNDEGRAYLNQQFEAMGMEYAPSYGNFIFVNIGMPSQEVNQKLLYKGIIIRPGFLFGFPNYLRISIGTMTENKRFIAALKEIKAEYDK